MWIYSNGNISFITFTLQWRKQWNPNHRRLDCSLNRFFRCRSKNTSKLRVTGLCKGSSPVTGEFPAQRASNAENVFIWWRHHASYHSVYGLRNEHIILFDNISSAILLLNSGHVPISPETKLSNTWPQIFRQILAINVFTSFVSIHQAIYGFRTAEYSCVQVKLY